jgi:hypothetical protein
MGKSNDFQIKNVVHAFMMPNVRIKQPNSPTTPKKTAEGGA